MAVSKKQTNERLEHLLARCALADKNALAELYKLTSAKLFAIQLKILKRRDWAEDALQDAYIKIWNQAGAYRPDKGNPLTWLISIARYRAIDMLRRTRPESGNVSLQDYTGQLTQQDTDPRWLIKHGDLLIHCLGKLQDTQRQALIMAYCEGYTHSELSLRLSSPVGTIKTWIRRGLESLRTCLDRGTNAGKHS